MVVGKIIKFLKTIDKYTIEKEEFEKLKTDVKKILDNVENLFEIFGK